MHTYTIEVKETLRKDIEISAHSREEALEEAERRYKEEEIELSAEDLKDVDYKIINSVE